MLQSVRPWLALAGLAIVACSSELPSTRRAADNSIEVQLSDGTYVSCDSPQGARQLVSTSEGTLLYAGQAYINQTCARGQCHNSEAVGEQRLGVPAGLDFELLTAPLDPTGLPEPEPLSRLRINQRRVYDWREQIWTQIDKGHMPPKGRGQPFRDDPRINQAVFGSDGICTQGMGLPDITTDEARNLLGVWLACGSPVIEASDARFVSQSAGDVGRRVPECEIGIDPMDVTFERVYSDVLEPSCVVCHQPGGIRPDSDYSTPEIAYDSLLNDPVEPACTGAPMAYVTPGEPEQSYLLHKMLDSQLQNPVLCGASMPFGQAPLRAGTQLVRAWIEAGAPGPGETASGSPGGDGGTSAPDAGM